MTGHTNWQDGTNILYMGSSKFLCESINTIGWCFFLLIVITHCYGTCKIQLIVIEDSNENNNKHMLNIMHRISNASCWKHIETHLKNTAEFRVSCEGIWTNKSIVWYPVVKRATCVCFLHLLFACERALYTIHYLQVCVVLHRIDLKKIYQVKAWK